MNTFQTEYEKTVSEICGSQYINQLGRIKSVSADRPVILYGAGKAAGIVLVVCGKSGLNVTALCDSGKSGMYENGGVSLPIITPRELVENYSNSSLIVTSWKFEAEIREKLKSIGFDDNNIFSFWYPQRITPEIFRRDYFDGYKWAYDFYTDEKSKRLVLDKTSSYLTSVPLSPNTTAEMYYDEVITLGENEVFLDGGAYDGDSVKNFVKKTGGKYEYIYAFEPDGKPFLQLKEYAAELSGIEIYNTGLGAESGVKTFFYDGLVASGFVALKYFATTGDKFSDAKFKTEDKNVTSIDSLMKEGKIKRVPTFIKLDVEGCESETINGAACLIRNHKPKFAVCAYHQVQDVYEIPKTILNIRDDYEFIIRQHDYGYYETVIYAY